jgi:hypothetical protein
MNFQASSGWRLPTGMAKEKPPDQVMLWALTIIVVGCVITCWRRLALIGRELRAKAA